MNLPRLSAVATLCAALAPCAALAADARSEKLARTDYLLHCSGCHGMDGSGHPTKGIPDFRDQVGYFVAIPEGRAMLMQVPGLLGSGLSDERAAAVTSWLVKQYAGASLPRDFEDYSGTEARRHRENRPVDITATRQRVYQQIVDAGYSLK